MRRQGMPNPTFEPFKNTSTLASAAHAKRRNTIWLQAQPRESQQRQGVPNVIFERLENIGLGSACETAKHHNGVCPEGPECEVSG